MRYNTLTLQDCRRFALERIDGDEPDIGAAVVSAGSGEELDLKPIRKAGRAISKLRAEVTDRDRIEGKAAVRLYDGCSGVGFEALDDPGFWRYLSVGFDDLWNFIAWREHRAFAKREPFLKYVDGKQPTECVLQRMYLRILALGGRDDPKEQFRDLAPALPTATDFWRSHVIRVQTAASPAVVRAFVRMQQKEKERLKTDDLREFAKDISKVRSAVVLSIYDDDEADVFIRDLRDRFDRRRGKS